MTASKTKNAVATKESDTPPNQLSVMWNGLVELAKDESVAPEKMTALLDMQRSMMQEQREQEFAAAMANARAAMPTISKDGAIRNRQGQVQSQYATYDAIDRIAKPIAAEHSLDYGFNIEGDETGKVMVTCEVTHLGTAGAYTKQYGPMPLAIDTTGSKNATQGAGSASQYGRRYTLCLAFNIRTEGQDDDGAGTGDTSAPQIAGFDPDELTTAAQKAATGGPQSYAEWFKAQTNMARGFLVDNGTHANCKAAAEEHG